MLLPTAAVCGPLEREWAQDSQRTTKERMFVRVRWAHGWRDTRQAEAAPCGGEVTPRTSPWCVEASEGGPAAGAWWPSGDRRGDLRKWGQRAGREQRGRDPEPHRRQVGGAWREQEWTGGQSPQQQSTRVLQPRMTQVTPVRVRRRGTERLETLRKESETRKRNKSVRNTQEGTESKVI